MRGYVSAADYQRVCDERDALTDEVRRLRVELGELTDSVAVDLLRNELRIDRAEAILVQALYAKRGAPMTRDALHRLASREGADPHCTVVRVCVVRRKLGAEFIRSVYRGSGGAASYALSRAAMERVAAVFRQEMAA
jgi:DNA-binding response OmpR family regulator